MRNSIILVNWHYDLDLRLDLWSCLYLDPDESPKPSYWTNILGDYKCMCKCICKLCP